MKSTSPTVTLYTDTMLAAELQNLRPDQTGDAEVVRENFGKYLDYVEARLTAAGVSVDREPQASSPGASYHSEDGKDIWGEYDIVPFWQWYN